LSASADAVVGVSTGDAPLVEYEFVGIQELSWRSALCFEIVSQGTERGVDGRICLESRFYYLVAQRNQQYQSMPRASTRGLAISGAPMYLVPAIIKSRSRIMALTPIVDDASTGHSGHISNPIRVHESNLFDGLFPLNSVSHDSYWSYP